MRIWVVPEHGEFLAKSVGVLEAELSAHQLLEEMLARGPTSPMRNVLLSALKGHIMLRSIVKDPAERKHLL